ncbi:NirD/YgiW/YdeI family stress tolerance protein [bacterium]|nr:NirD/YgiW/YdeI family stress tolerance protein [bacterium]
MKKLCLILSIVFVTSSLAFAAPNVGFQDGTNNKVTITEALKMNDDSYVTIQGNIIKRVSDDKYIFKDSTGTMTVEIDTEKWAGQSVNMTDRLELTGEIEKKFNSTVLDVDTVKIIKK